MADLKATFDKIKASKALRPPATREKQMATLYTKVREFKESFETSAMRDTHDEYESHWEEWDAFFDECTEEDELQALYVRLIDPTNSEEASREIVWSIEIARWNKNDVCPALFDLWLRRWEYPGALARHQETAYDVKIEDLNEVQRSYDSASPHSLRRALLLRGLPDPCPCGLTLKYVYIKALLAADRVPFRLLDLPPEMRMMVYGHLLTMQSGPSDKLRAFPAILRACRQVNSEATRVLYSGPIICKLEVVNSSPSGPIVFTVHNEKVEMRCHHHSKFLNIPEAITQYPDFLRRCTHLKTIIIIRSEVPRDLLKMCRHMQTVNHCLLTLASFLVDSHSIKQLSIVWDSDKLPTCLGWSIENMLYPLRRLRNVKRVEICNRGVDKVPDKVTRAFVRDIQSSEPVFNTLKHFILIRDEASELMEFGELMNPVCDFEPDMFDPTTLGFRFEMVETAISQGFMSAQTEENFQARLGQVKTYLELTSLPALEAQLSVLQKKRAARKVYDGVSDDGKIAEAFGIWSDHVYDDDWRYDSQNWLDVPKEIQSDEDAEDPDASTAVERDEVTDRESDSEYNPSLDSKQTSDVEQESDSDSDC